MKFLKREQLMDLSFPDSPVVDFNFDIEKKELKFVADAFVGTSPDGIWFDDALVTIDKFDSFRLLEEDKKEITVYTEDLALREICEFEYTNDFIIMRSFSAGHGLWTEFILKNATLKVEYYKKISYTVW